MMANHLAGSPSLQPTESNILLLPPNRGSALSHQSSMNQSIAMTNTFNFNTSNFQTASDYVSASPNVSQYTIMWSASGQPNVNTANVNPDDDLAHWMSDDSDAATADGERLLQKDAIDTGGCCTSRKDKEVEPKKEETKSNGCCQGRTPKPGAFSKDEWDGTSAAFSIPWWLKGLFVLGFLIQVTSFIMFLTEFILLSETGDACSLVHFSWMTAIAILLGAVVMRWRFDVNVGLAYNLWNSLIAITVVITLLDLFISKRNRHTGDPRWIILVRRYCCPLWYWFVRVDLIVGLVASIFGPVVMQTMRNMHHNNVKEFFHETYMEKRRAEKANRTPENVAKESHMNGNQGNAPEGITNGTLIPGDEELQHQATIPDHRSADVGKDHLYGTVVPQNMTMAPQNSYTSATSSINPPMYYSSAVASSTQKRTESGVI